jgi:hypothetical protein
MTNVSCTLSSESASGRVAEGSEELMPQARPIGGYGGYSTTWLAWRESFNGYNAPFKASRAAPCIGHFLSMERLLEGT